jgi:hypothetical protein
MMLQILLICVWLSFLYADIASEASADNGGSRGWALSFSENDQYASVPNYFPSADYWPTTSITGEKKLNLIPSNSLTPR